MKGPFWLTDDQWALIKPHLPYRAAGKRREDDRRIISGILHVLQSGCRWQDCPSQYGPRTTVYNRYNRWSKNRLRAASRSCNGVGPIKGARSSTARPGMCGSPAGAGDGSSGSRRSTG